MLQLAMPLILSTGAHTVQMFVDRMFLAWYSSDAVAAAVPAGLASFIFVSFFMGLVSYSNTFVAQYTGSGQYHRIGPAVWQGLFIAVLAGSVLVWLIPVAPVLFSLFGHPAAITTNEITYFRIIIIGSGPVLVCAAISSFFTGRGKTVVVMMVNIINTTINIVLDYGMIFGHWGFSRRGIAGAAWATVIASGIAATIYLMLFLRANNRLHFNTLRGARLERDLMGRLIRYGLPNGVQFMLDILAFTFFVMFVGRIDKVALAASNITFQINMLAFMPMIGFGIAVSTLVGQYLGKNDEKNAQRSVWSAFMLTFSYMLVIAMGYWFKPGWFLLPFSSGISSTNTAATAEFVQITTLARQLLCFVAFYCLFDTGNIIFSGALKGAGDTRYVMVMGVTMCWMIMVIPCWVVVHYKLGPHKGLFAAWGFLTMYVCVLAVAYLRRFLGGKWKKMRVIEKAPVSIPAMIPEVPVVETETS